MVFGNSNGADWCNVKLTLETAQKVADRIYFSDNARRIERLSSILWRKGFALYYPDTRIKGAEQRGPLVVKLARQGSFQ